MERFENKYQKKHPFTVPEGYFGVAEEQIMGRITQKPEKKPRLMTIVLPYLGLTAIFIMAFMIVQIVVPRFVDEDKMIKRTGSTVLTVQEQTETEYKLDNTFNPSSEDIFEYLSSELRDYGVVYAEIY